jgi:hypothetical protein
VTEQISRKNAQNVTGMLIAQTSRCNLYETAGHQSTFQSELDLAGKDLVPGAP